MTELQEYAEYLGRLPISKHTKRNYLLRVRKYLDWLAGCPDGVKAMSNPVERDFAVQDFKTFLLQRGSSSNTVNAILAAVDNFYMFRGLGPAKVRRQDLPAVAPRALEPDEQRRLLKVVAQSSLRNRAIALVMLHCGLRISEVSQLNVGDVLLSARKRELIVRCGKNNKRRSVPINSDLAEVLLQYLATISSAPDAPLFISQKRQRISVQGIDYIVRKLGRDAGVDFSAHCLRHTCLTRLVRAGLDIVVVAELAGHSRLETSRRYTLPSEQVRQEAVEKLNYGAKTT